MDLRIFQENIEENTIITDITSNNITDTLLHSDNSTTINISSNSENVEHNEHIEHNLNCDTLNECIICLDSIRIDRPTWSCLQCKQVFHLQCKESWEIISPQTIFTCPHCKYKAIPVKNQPQQHTVDTHTEIYTPTLIDHITQHYNCHSKCHGCLCVICSITCVFILFISIYYIYTSCIEYNSYYNYTYIH